MLFRSSVAALLDFRPVLRNLRALRYILAYCAHNWELFAFRSWVVAFLSFSQGLQDPGGFGRDWSAPTIAAVLNLLGLPASILGGEAALRFGRQAVVVAVMAVSAAMACVIGFTAALPFAAVIAAAAVYAVLVSGESASVTAGVVNNAKEDLRGTTMAVHTFIGFAGAFTGPIVFGVVLDLAGGGARVASWGAAFAVSGLAVALGPVAVIWLARRARRSPL